MTPPTVKILIVDDELDNAELIELHLESLGYDTVAVSDGESAIALLDESPESWSVVLLDRKMPGVDGIEVATYIRNNPKLRYIPVIMQTACASNDELKEGIDAGVYHYLTKPFTGEMLRSVVRSALELRLKYEQLRTDSEDLDKTLGLLQSACFKFKTLKEGCLLSTQLANQFDNSNEIALGLNELITNAIEHGNLGITFEEKTELIKTGEWLEEVERRQQQPNYRDRIVELSIEKYPRRVCISIKDEGEGFDWGPYMGMSTTRIFHNHGRGIAIANVKCFDDIQFLGCGNEVRVEILLVKPVKTKNTPQSIRAEIDELAPA